MAAHLLSQQREAPSPFRQLGKNEDVRFRELVEEHFRMFQVLTEIKCNGFSLTNDHCQRILGILDGVMKSQQGMNGGAAYRAPLIRLPGPL